MPKNADLWLVSQVAFYLAFAINHPHFLSSYMLLYGDLRSEMAKKKRYFWAAVIVPVTLGIGLATALLQANQVLMGYIIHSMFFLVGWHYIKQVFGCVIVTSAQQKKYFSAFERKVLLANLFSAGLMSWLIHQVTLPDGSPGGGFKFYGITYPRFNLPYWTIQALYGFVALSFAAVVVMTFLNYKRTGKWPAWPGIMAFFALYVWYIPISIHPAFAYFIPAFHSMQYMAFVWRLKANQTSSQVQNEPLEKRNRVWFEKLAGWMAWALIFGALAFQFIPVSLDRGGWIRGMGETPFLAGFLLFINIHHYFIDNVIWRSDNETVKKFLMSPVRDEPTVAIHRKSA